MGNYEGELLLTSHGTGCYTAQSALKRMNRVNERLAAAAEGAAVFADWLGALPYPRQALTDAWVRFLWHQFHDDLTGTGIPEDYVFSWNDEILVHNRLAGVLSEAVGAIARSLDSRVQGQALLVWNPLALSRSEVVEALVRYPDGPPPEAVRVWGAQIPDDPHGVDLPAQVLARGPDWLRIAFLASDLPALGAAIYDVQSAASPATAADLSVGDAFLESPCYRVELDAQGDIASVWDKGMQRELLSAPIRLGVFGDTGLIWPAWEIRHHDTVQEPKAFAGDTPRVEIVERGPARVALRVTREALGSTFVQTIRMAAGGGVGEVAACGRVDVTLDIDWRTQRAFAKAVFPLASANPLATWDLGLGVIQRPNASESLYEVPGQRWADLSAPDGSFGVTVMSDARYGWDKPDDGTLRLTLVRTPLGIDFEQDTMDLGRHRTGYSLMGHPGGWQRAVRAGLTFDQAPFAFQVPVGRAGERTRQGFVEVDADAVQVMAVKRAEQGDEVIVRLREAQDVQSLGVRLRVGEGIVAARQVTGGEQEIPSGGIPVEDDGSIMLYPKPFQPLTLALTLAPPAQGLDAPESRPLVLPLDTDIVSSNDARADGVFDPAYRRVLATPADAAMPVAFVAEQWPEVLLDRGVSYALGSAAAGQPNALRAAGQRIALDPRPGERLYLLAAGTRALETTLRLEGKGVAEVVPLRVPAGTGVVGQWDSRVVDGVVVQDPDLIVPGFVDPTPVAWYGSHLHAPDRDLAYEFGYLYRFALALPPGTDALVLPDEPHLLVAAATLAQDPNDWGAPASALYDGHEPLDEAPDPYVQAWLTPPDALPDADADALEPADTQAEADPSGGGGCYAAGRDAGAPWALLLVGAWLLARRFRPSPTPGRLPQRPASRSRSMR